MFFLARLSGLLILIDNLLCVCVHAVGKYSVDCRRGVWHVGVVNSLVCFGIWLLVSRLDDLFFMNVYINLHTEFDLEKLNFPRTTNMEMETKYSSWSADHRCFSFRSLPFVNQANKNSQAKRLIQLCLIKCCCALVPNDGRLRSGKKANIKPLPRGKGAAAWEEKLAPLSVKIYVDDPRRRLMSGDDSTTASSSTTSPT